MINCDINIRLPEENKRYYKNQLEIFTRLFNEDNLLSIQFGKQDMRGTESITLVDKKRCVPFQKNFNNKWELLGYVVGFNENYYSKINNINLWCRK